jgi:hypothetical protein
VAEEKVTVDLTRPEATLLLGLLGFLWLVERMTGEKALEFDELLGAPHELVAESLRLKLRAAFPDAPADEYP